MVNDENVEAVISEIAGLGDDQISPTLYDTYSENLRKAVDQAFKRDNNSGMSDQLRANVSRFAAYKAMNITKEVRGELGNDLDKAAHILRTANRTQATEYNTTISRCRTAKQFEQFNSPNNLRLFPNLRWLPSRSADPREAHMLFYNNVWAKDDDFWNENTPGSLWNCKCDWEETDDPVTRGNPQGNKSAKGLNGNPEKTGKVFSEDHPYFSNTNERSELNVLRIIRKSIKGKVREKLVGKEIEREEFDKPIKISRRGIEEFINQPFDSYYEKNELLLRIDEVMKRSKYVGETTSKGRRSYIFETTVTNRIAYIIVNESDDNSLYLYSITRSDKVIE